MKIENLKTSSLIPYARNSRTHSDAQIGQIASSIREFGFTNPVLISDSNDIIAGHGRVLAAQRLKLTDVPCIRLSHLSETQRRAYVIADNKLALNAGWDEEMLKLELEELNGVDFDAMLAGFNESELADIMGSEDATARECAEDAVPDVPEDAVTNVGDMWLLGDHRLLCGDSADPRSVDVVLGGEDVGVTVLDPPYDLADHVWSRWITDPCILFGQMRHLLMVPRKLWRFERIVVKKYRHRSATVQVDHRHAFVAQIGSVKHLPKTKETFPSVIEQEVDRDHDHAKPVKLVVEHLTKWTPPWNIVFDPYMGSGTTLIAADQMGRKCYGMEISPQFCDVIVKRWETLTGKKATLNRAAQIKPAS